MGRTLAGRAVISGSAEGVALVSREPISFWGGVNPETGEIIDARHGKAGAVVTGRVFLFPHEKGSSTSSATILESIRLGTAPAAIITLKTPPITALGIVVAQEMYQRSVPLVVLPEEAFHSIQEDDHLAIEPDGTVRVTPRTGETAITAGLQV